MKLKYKLIIILSSVFFLTLFLDFYLGSLYFEKYFRFTKINSLEKIDFIENNQIDLNKLKEYKISKNANVTILNNDNKFISLSSFNYFILKDKKTKNIIILSPYLSQLYLKNKFILKKNDKLKLKTINIFNNYFMAYEIIRKNDKIIDFDINIKNNKLVALSGKIYSLPIKTNKKTNEILEIYPYINLFKNQSKIYESYDKTSFYIISKKIDRFRIIIYYKFKPINEIFPMLKLYFILKIIFLVLIIIILGLILEKLIIDPIINLAKNTNKIGNLNFKLDLTYKKRDEIGFLYNNINIMLNKLENIIYLYKKENQDNIKAKIEFEEELKLFMHEIKTPLSAIIGFTDLFLAKNKSENIQIVHDEGKRLLRLADELINKKNITQNISLKKNNFNLTELIELILKIYEKELININLQFEASSIFVYADKEKIKQVIINFLTNAIEHTSSDIIIKLVPINNKIEFSIENNGSKLSEDEKNNIWKKYYSTKAELGRGLGLFISSEIIKLHNNKYNVSITDNGIRFSFYLDKSEI